jgi:hypothetical protein
MKIVLRGSTRVVKNHLENDEEDVSSADVLKMIASKNDELQSLFNDEAAFSQYLHDGSEQADSIVGRLIPGGWVSLVFDDSDGRLYVETGYEAKGDLAPDEIEFLVRETLGQWSDGAGGSAMDDFSEFIDPYYVELDEYRPENVVVRKS